MTNETLRAHCNNCNNFTKHHVLHEVSAHWPEENYYEGADYQTLQCLGCESVKLKELWFCQGMGDQRVETYYPPQAPRRFPSWAWKWETAHGLRRTPGIELFREIYRAMQYDQPRLAAMGIRALFEHIMIDKIGDQGTFGKNLAAFRDQGFVTPRQHESVKAALEIGHAAIHRGFKPSMKDLATALDILEHVIQATYVHEGQVSSLTPPPARSE